MTTSVSSPILTKLDTFFKHRARSTSRSAAALSLILYVLLILYGGISCRDDLNRRDTKSTQDTKSNAGEQTTSDDFETTDNSSATDSATLEPDTSAAQNIQMSLVHSIPWPGGGYEHTARVLINGRTVSTDELIERLTVQWDDSVNAKSTVTPIDLSPGYTAVLVAPPRSEETRNQLVANLQSFFDTRPNDERIGVYLWIDEIVQIGNFTNESSRLKTLLERFYHLEATDDRLPIDVAGKQMSYETQRIGGPGFQGMRSVIILGENIEAEQATYDFAVPMFHVRIGDEDGLNRVGETIDDLMSNAHYSIASCVNPKGALGNLIIENSNTLELVAGPSLSDEIDMPCDPNRIGPGKYVYTDEISFSFDSEQRAVFDEMIDERSEDDFFVSLQMSRDRHPIQATAHQRGQSALYCERRSFTVAVKEPKRLFPGSFTDEFYLISMCNDDHYIQEYTSNQIMSELNLFPLKFAYVMLTIDDENQGVYIMMEKRKEELVADNGRVQSVMRRRISDSTTVMETSYPSSTDDAPAVAYAEFEANLQGLTGIEFEAAVGANLDLERYLRWVALMTAFENGDYVDELIIMSTEQWIDGGVTNWYEPMGWDNDDLFSQCHVGRGSAFEDPFELVYCAESQLDQLLFSDTQIYVRYVDILAWLLNDVVTPSRFQEAINTTADALLPFVVRPEVIEAMDDLKEKDPNTFMKDMADDLESFQADFEARRMQLLERIDAYRLAPDL